MTGCVGARDERGSPTNPPSDEEVAAKLREKLAFGDFGRGTVEVLQHLVSKLVAPSAARIVEVLLTT